VRKRWQCSCKGKEEQGPGLKNEKNFHWKSMPQKKGKGGVREALTSKARGAQIAEQNRAKQKKHQAQLTIKIDRERKYLGEGT